MIDHLANLRPHDLDLSKGEDLKMLGCKLTRSCAGMECEDCLFGAEYGPLNDSEKKEAEKYIFKTLTGKELMLDEYGLIPFFKSRKKVEGIKHIRAQVFLGFKEAKYLYEQEEKRLGYK